MRGEVRLRGIENGERADGTAAVKQATAAGGNRLVVAATRTEKVAELVVAATEALCRRETLEPAHTSDAAFHAPMILLQPVILVGAGPVHDPPAERRADRPRVGTVTVGRDALGCHTGSSPR